MKEKTEAFQLTQALKKEYRQNRPVEVALTLPMSWEEGDIIPEVMAEKRLKLLIESLPEEIRASKERSIKRDPQFHARIAIAQDKAWEYARRRNWLNENSYRTKNAKSIVLRKMEDLPSALEVGNQFRLEEFRSPQCMWDSLIHKRVSQEMILAIYGDDRNGIEGEYFLLLSYCHEAVNKLWFPELPYCGAF
jgi:hypothetical protein